MRPILHVGFAHTGTSSLQQNLFSKRDDILYCGLPHSLLGGIFSNLKYQGRNYDPAATAKLALEYIHARKAQHQRIVVSDETLVDQPEIYHTPHMQPAHTIAMRLHTLFPEAKILFTIRNPMEIATSSYLICKRNFAVLSHRAIESFDEWFAGNHSQVTNLYLRNLDQSMAVMEYAEIFGTENVSVLPLELLKRQGARAYLKKLEELVGLPISEADIDHYGQVQNARMSVGEEKIIEQWVDPEFRARYTSLDEALKQAMPSEPVTIELNDAQHELIHERTFMGNRLLAERFGLPLAAYGYPLA